MGPIGKTVISALVGILGIIALYFAARAHDGGIYYGGLVIFVTCVMFIFYQIKRHMDEVERGEHG